MSVKRTSRNPMEYAHSVKSVPKIIGLSKAYFEKEKTMKLAIIEEQVANYPDTGDYDVNIWCDNECEENDPIVSVTFYPLYRGKDGYLHTDTSVYYSLPISLNARGPKQRAALSYVTNLVNSDGGVLGSQFDREYTDWWSNVCVLTDAPELISDFIWELPRNEQLQQVRGE